MAKKYHQVNPKVPKEVLFGLIGVLVIIFGLFLLTLRSNEEKIFDAYAVTDATITENHPFYEVSYEGTLFNDGIQDILAKERFVILYIGSPLCSFCVQTIGHVETYFNQEGFGDIVGQVYYYQDFVGEDASSDREAMLTDFPTIERITPQLIAFLDGEIFLEYTAPENENYAGAVSWFFEDLMNALEDTDYLG